MAARLTEKSRMGKAVVMGAGTMGGGIAAQLANAGWSVRLLDVTEETARAGWDRVKTSKPPLLYVPEFAGRIQTGSIDSAGDYLSEADWVVEAVAEKMAVKRAVLAQVEAQAGPDAVVSSNTSGLSLREMTQGRSADFRRRFLGSHFLNPPRYLKLLEVIPLPDTDPSVVEGFARFAEQVLGQRVVFARDTPGFISTRIGIRHLLDSIRLAVAHGLMVEETDFLTGPLIGRPRSGTFRLADMIGLDILATIASDQAARLPSESEGWTLPPVVAHLLAEGHVGAKSGAGFYKRDGAQTLALDLNTGGYRPRREVERADPGMNSRALRKRMSAFADKRKVTEGGSSVREGGQWPVLALDFNPGADISREGDRGGSFIHGLLNALADYVARVGPGIAHDAEDIDRVMRWGFGWEMGPQEIADCRAGVERRQPRQDAPEYLSLAALKEAGGTVWETPEATLIDMGDGAACLEFHVKMNVFSPALCACVNRARERAERDFAALVIGNQGPHFSAGYDVNLFLAAMAAEDWEGIDQRLREVQQVFSDLQHSIIPVLAAPHGYTLGAGCECVLHCASVHAAPELYIGLPETLVGVIPAGGGTKELLARAMTAWGGQGDAFPFVERVFDRLMFPRTSGSAEEARRNGFLRPGDSVGRNADRQLYEAKQLALGLAEAGYRPPTPRGIRVLGNEFLARLRMKIHHLFRAGTMTEQDRLIADRLAWLLSGGVTHPQEVSEEHLLRLEREVFLQLAQTPKSQARMRHTLTTGKPLRN